MKQSLSMEFNGLAVSLSVQLKPEDVRQLVGDHPFVFSAEESVEHLAPVVAQELPKLLLQAHSLISQSLLAASIQLLNAEAAA